MKFVVVDELPVAKRHKNRVNYKGTYNHTAKQLEEFVAMGVKYVRVEFYKGEYSGHESMRITLRDSLNRCPDLPIKVVQRGTDIYLVRTDM